MARFTPRTTEREMLVCNVDVRRNSDNALSHARHMTPTAAALVGARRRRPSPPTDGSHGRAVSKNLGRCAPDGCSATSGRSPETPGSLPSTPGPEGERQWSAASATLRSAPRPHRLRRASMARRSTAACSVCSRHSVQPRQAPCDGLQGRRGPPRAQWPSSVPVSYTHLTLPTN